MLLTTARLFCYCGAPIASQFGKTELAPRGRFSFLQQPIFTTADFTKLSCFLWHVECGTILYGIMLFVRRALPPFECHTSRVRTRGDGCSGLWLAAAHRNTHNARITSRVRGHLWHTGKY